MRAAPGGVFVVAAAFAATGCVAPTRPAARTIAVAPPTRAMPAQRAAAAPVPSVQRPVPMGPVRGEAPLRIAMLSAHNSTRVPLGIAPLTWDPGLAREATAYAAQMARSNSFGHAQQIGYAEPEGENLWMGTRGAYRFEEMAGYWRDERRYFMRAAIPYASRSGRFEDVGHYTQMIWRGTTHIGCGIAGNGQDEYLVCRYWPAGNVFGRDPFSN
jgi:hypothetical protein